MKCPNCGKTIGFFRAFCLNCKTKLDLPPRPKSITVLAWIFIVTSCLGLVYVVIAPEEKDYLAILRSHHPFQAAFYYCSAVLTLICSIGALRGQNWARWVLVGYLGLNCLSSVYFGKALHAPDGKVVTMVLTRVAVFIVVTYYLFRASAKPFFLGQTATVAVTK